MIAEMKRCWKMEAGVCSTLQAAAAAATRRQHQPRQQRTNQPLASFKKILLPLVSCLGLSGRKNFQRDKKTVSSFVLLQLLQTATLLLLL